MRVRLWLAALAACALVAAAVGSQIGVGLDWRTGLYVQEYWQGGKPRYLIANLSREPATITVQTVNIDVREGGRAFREANPLPQKPVETLAGPWEVPAGGAADVDASPLLGKGLAEFRSGGKRLGLLDLAKPPAAAPAEAIVTTHGVNGSGGRQTGLWCEHPALRVAAGADIEVKLITAAGQGTLSLGTKSKPPEEKDGIVTSPAHLAPAEAVCDTLPVAASGGAVVIDTGKPLKDQPSHTVLLRFKAPAVAAPTLVTFGGWVQHRGGGYWLIRALVIEPRSAQ
ncbi:MAG TPA: hypothetical protein PLE19_11950 [Planctomycetota bacterium]|nr:hypothetical protein [Planctomycetota bacterium]HRR81069.1 hypothetical protein [Planctomycetota bacterium]HRT97892.1 hypothetical protein [Planctomycetota bacterium]